MSQKYGEKLDKKHSIFFYANKILSYNKILRDDQKLQKRELSQNRRKIAITLTAEKEIHFNKINMYVYKKTANDSKDSDCFCGNVMSFKTFEVSSCLASIEGDY